MTEAELQALVMLELNKLPGVVVWRNTVGTGRTTHGAWVTFGLAPGSSDLIGLVAPHGRFLALEIKSARGYVRPEQRLFCDLVRSVGGVAAVVRTLDDAFAAVDAARKARDGGD